MAREVQPGQFVLNRTVWELPPGRYSDLYLIGGGTFGQVVRAADNYLGAEVALKKLTSPFASKEHAKRTYREIAILRHLRGNNINRIIPFLGAFSPEADAAQLSSVYIVCELAPCTLKQVLDCQQISEEHARFITYQLLVGINYMHSAGILHRDLKPSNIAIWGDTQIKILDFGLARVTLADHDLTQYVVSRWYRAPEILTQPHYNTTADVWSVACIAAECLSNQVLFKGDDMVTQILAIIEVLGSPEPAFLESCATVAARTYLQSLGQRPGCGLETRLPGCSIEAIHFLKRVLVYDPTQRPSALDLLTTDLFLRDNYHPDDVVACEPMDQKFEMADLPLDVWKHMIFELLQSINEHALEAPGAGAEDAAAAAAAAYGYGAAGFDEHAYAEAAYAGTGFGDDADAYVSAMQGALEGAADALVPDMDAAAASAAAAAAAEASDAMREGA